VPGSRGGPRPSPNSPHWLAREVRLALREGVICCVIVPTAHARVRRGEKAAGARHAEDSARSSGSEAGSSPGIEVHASASLARGMPARRARRSSTGWPRVRGSRSAGVVEGARGGG